MKYEQRINQTEDQVKTSANSFAVRTAELSVKTAQLNKERELDQAEGNLEQLKSQNPLSITDVMSAIDKVDLLKRDIKNLKALEKELF